VRDGENGLVVEPTAAALATALARVTEDAAWAERLGRQALEDVAGLTWSRTVEQLVRA
jgi:glycosyltransferase involved in cell wall biosynthesis